MLRINWSQVLKKVTLYSLILGVTNYSFSIENTTNDQVPTAIQAHSGDKFGKMLLQSISLIGVPYKWGGNTPDSGLDCSGFIRYIFKQSLGITLPRTADEIAKLGSNIPLDQLEPGDLLFFNTNGGKRISHMGMYLGNNRFIQAPRTGKDIEITEFNRYYKNKFVVAKRMVQEGIDENGQTNLNDLREERAHFAMKGVSYSKKKEHARIVHVPKGKNKSKGRS